MKDSPDGAGGGASAAAIRSHYDVGDDFYRLWLDNEMVYSCALWEGSASLEEAQLRKLDFHVDRSRSANVSRVLDVGCGWGALLKRLVVNHGVRRAVGLTLSESQAKLIDAASVSGVEVRLESWRDHSPEAPYDSIVSIGALEHFVRPDQPSDARVETYRDFFRRCHSWLKPDGMMSLQTIAYGVGNFVRGAISDIFPESDLPRLPEIATAAEGLFEVVELQNGREDYARTCREWAMRLSQAQEEAERLVGPEVARHYGSYLRAAARGFDLGIFVLYRISLARVDDRVARAAASFT